MDPSRSIAVSVAFLLAMLASPTSRTSAQSPAPPARAQRSVHGKLESLVASQNGVIMRSDNGEKLAWKFNPSVIAEMARFKPGDPMIVVYRQISPSEKRVTAVAFPGTAATPTYVNMTGERVSLRSAPAVGGVCGQIDPGPISESTIPVGGRAEVLEACWCCAPSGEICTSGNKSGFGQALLVKCFQ